MLLADEDYYVQHIGTEHEWNLLLLDWVVCQDIAMFGSMHNNDRNHYRTQWKLALPNLKRLYKKISVANPTLCLKLGEFYTELQFLEDGIMPLTRTELAFAYRTIVTESKKTIDKSKWLHLKYAHDLEGKSTDISRYAAAYYRTGHKDPAKEEVMFRELVYTTVCK